MDSQSRDETRIRQREETLARRVGEALDRLNSGGAGACPDAEIIAAYSDEALDPAETAQWEGHFAACARCRKILRVLAASTEAPLAEQEVARLGERVAAAQTPVDIAAAKATVARRGAVAKNARWLAPALGVAAVLAVWFAMRPPWRATDHGDSTSLVAQAPKEEMPSNPVPAATDQLSRNAPARDQKTEPQPSFDRSAATSAPLGSSPGVRAKSDATTATATGALDEAKKTKSMPEAREMQAPVTSPAPPPSKQAQAAMPAAPQPQSTVALNSSAAATPQSETNSNAVRNAPARDAQASANETLGASTVTAPSKVSPELRADVRKEQAFRVVTPLQKDSALLKAPSSSVLWRVGKSGSIERSTDAGKTWAAQTSPSQEDWLAGAAISERICWLAGRHGVLARTVDGEHWERIAPPAQAARTGGAMPDWTDVTASDFRSATITAADGRKFATADGGKTWQSQ
jgi:hypothetical protein